MKNKIILPLSMLMIVTNCVSTKTFQLSSSDSLSMRGKTIIIIRDEKPSFAAMTYGNMMIAGFTGGALGAWSIIHDGNKIINENKIEDPVIIISEKLVGDIKVNYGSKIVREEIVKNISTSTSKISSQYQDSADYVLDIRTINWSFGYLPFQPTTYKVMYSAKIKLIDTKASKIVAEGFCNSIPKNTYKYNILLDNKAENLKNELVQAANACSILFKETVFNIK